MTTDSRALSAELLAMIKSMGAQSSMCAKVDENDDLINRAIDASPGTPTGDAIRQWFAHYHDRHH